ncbi:MAG TPA: hypothetical protein VE085_12415 [Burkholderiales bacterium]|nr:hypothetical protein [Burkholderiales bacterium]
MTRSALRQRGAALMLLLAVLVMGAAWFVVRRLDAIAGDFTAANRTYNAQVLSRAKQALIGYVAAQAAKAFEDNPGALPCPEAPASFNSGSGTDGKMASSCTLPVVGRFPWRTIGMDKLLDASGEPLWYVISTGWAYTGSNTVINSNSLGQLTVDGSAGSDADTVVALIIAPGPPVSVTASTGCTAWPQTRPASGSPDLRNYLECENATSPADATFVTAQSNTAFNDQVVRITKADIMPGIEAAITHRIEREVVPQLKAVYNSATWSTNISAANPMYPYPATFADPSLTASYHGSAASCSGNVCTGLLPVIFTNNAGASTICTAGGSSLCDPLYVNWTSGTIEVKSVTVSGTTYVPGTIPGVAVWSVTLSNCNPTTSGTPASPQLDCPAAIPSLSGVVTTNVIYEVKGIASNLGMALRRFDPAATLPGLTVTTAPTVAMSSTGSATMTFRGSTTAPTGGSTLLTPLCGLSSIVAVGIECRQVTIPVPLAPLFPDHGLLNSNDSTWGWFMRNEWYRVLYYVAAKGDTANPLPAAPTCATASTCLNVANVTPAAGQRAILILAGRGINGTTRSTGTAADYVEFGNASGAFERQRITTLPAAAYADTGAANAYAFSATTVTTGVPLYFKAANTNTGASTLTTVATGTKNLRNADASVLAAGAISAKGVVQVTYDGTQFLLNKRPFNDRIIVVDCSNPGASALPCDNR